MQQDFDAGLRVDRIEVNPFVLSLRVNGLELDNPEGEPGIRIEEIFANFQLSSIYRLALTFDEIRITSPELFIARDASGNMDFAYLLKPANGDSDEVAAADAQDASLPQALVYRFSIENSYINWTDRVPQEPVKTRFGPIEIAINDLNTLPNRPGQQSVVIATENSGTLSWTGDLQLNPLHTSARATLRDLRFPLISAYIRHQAGVDIVDGSADVDLDYELYTTAGGAIEARVSNFNLTLSDIAVDSFADGSGIDLAGPDQQILRLPKLQLTDGRLQWPERIVALGSISIDRAQIDTARDADGVFNLEPRRAAAGSATKVTAADNEAANSDDEWQVSVGKLAVNELALNLRDNTLTPAAILGVTAFNLSVSDISNLPGKRFPTTLSLQALSGGRLSLTGDVSVLPQPNFEFDADIDAIQLTVLQPYIGQQINLKLDSGALNLDGRLSGSAEEPLSFNGELEVVDLSIAESIDGKRLASWKSLRAEKIALSLAERKLDISRVHFDRLYGDILINQDGSLNFGQVKKAAADATVTDLPKTPADSDADGTAAPLKTRIGKVVLAGASADFADLSLPLPFAVTINALNGNMTTISTASSEPSEVTFEGKVDEYGLARIGGTITPLNPAENTDLMLSFENIDVPKFTPYSIPFAGREIASGRLDLKLGYQVKGSQLVGENSIILRDFELGKKVPHPGAMDLPLGLAVALLKDVNGKIDIDLPVSGNVDDPQFSYGDVVLGALGKLLLKIVVSPFAALGSLLGIEASELEHIKFLDGRSDLTPPEMEKAEKLAEALVLRPELHLRIAGVYDAEADALALRSAQLDAALQQKITELEAASDPEIQYADLRRMALEELYREQLAVADAGRSLQDLRQQFTTLVEVEDQAEPVPSLDRLAYANALRKQLIDLQKLDENDLAELASARAEALKTALTGLDESLQARISIAEYTAVTRDEDEAIKMKVTLSGNPA